MADTYPLPTDTCALVKAHYSSCDNRNLLFSRYLWGDFSDAELKFKVKPDQQAKIFDSISKIKEQISPLAKSRMEAMLKSLSASGITVKAFELTTSTRMIVGLGGKGAMEVGFSFHPLYGFPYIPGSALKGLTRSWLETAEDKVGNEAISDKMDIPAMRVAKKIFGSASKDEKLETHTKDEVLKELFKKEGFFESKMGEVTFFDAIPVGEVKLEADIMNPHYGPYYESKGENAPGDWYSPVPVKFLTVVPGQKFFFALAAKKEHAESLNFAENWLRNGLIQLGVGSKTNSGYGYFKEPGNQKSLSSKTSSSHAPLEEDIEDKEWAITFTSSDLVEEKSELDLFKDGVLDNLLKAKNNPIDPSTFINQAYELWKKIDDEQIKTDLAKKFMSEFNERLTKAVANKKKYALELSEYASK